MAISHVSMVEAIEPIQRSDCGRRSKFSNLERPPNGSKWVVCKWGISLNNCHFRRKKKGLFQVILLTFPVWDIGRWPSQIGGRNTLGRRVTTLW